MTLWAYFLLAVPLVAWWFADRAERRDSERVNECLSAPLLKILKPLYDWEQENWA